jgi:hypothetical protein
VSEDDPEADPAGGKAHVHGVANVAVEADNDQALGRGDGDGGAAAGPAEIPDAAQGYGESESGGNRG